MAKQSGLGDNFYIGGYDLSGDVSSVDQMSGGPALLDVTAISQSANSRLGGLRSADWQFTSFFDAGNELTTGSHAALSTLPRADVVANYLRGTAIGNAAAGIVAKQINYDPTRDTSGNLTLKVELQANAYGYDWGTQLTAGLQTDTSDTSHTGIDQGASSTFGAQAYLQVTNVVGTSATVTIYHSTDDSTWVSLMAFGSVAAGSVSGQRLAVTGTVDRYVQVVTSGTFSSVTFAVVLVRNKVAVAF